MATAAVEGLQDGDALQFVSHTAADIDQRTRTQKRRSSNNKLTNDAPAAASAAAAGGDGDGCGGEDEYEDDPDHVNGDAEGDAEAEGITSTSIPSTIAPDSSAMDAQGQGRAKLAQKMDKLMDMLDGDDASLYNISFNTKHSIGAALTAQYMKGDDFSVSHSVAAAGGAVAAAAAAMAATAVNDDIE